jgi:putative Mg2+ transporter-C (MgtC) family protein
MDWSVLGSEAARVASAALLCSLMGLERQYHQKAAGVRTHALVGMGACLFTIVGLHPWDVAGGVSPSGDAMRVAAQVVSGIGFLGAGVIFVNRDAVRGLTTAAGIWVAAAIGMACGARMIPLAAVATALYLLVLMVIGPLAHRMPTRDRDLLVRLTYPDRSGTLRRILTAATEMGFQSAVLSTRQRRDSDPPSVEVVVRFTGGLPLRDLVAELSEVPGVASAALFQDSHEDEE